MTMRAKITRKDFIRAGLASVAGAIAPPTHTDAKACSWGGGAEAAPRRNDMAAVLRLYPAKAIREGKVRFGEAEIGVMIPFFGKGELTWVADVPEGGAHRVSVCCSTTTNATVTVSAGKSSLDHRLEPTVGYFTPDPAGASPNPGGPDSDTFWSEREYYGFERVRLDGQIMLGRGINVIKLAVEGPEGREIARVRSLELWPLALQEEVLCDQRTAVQQRASPPWFADAGYGLWFHFLDLTTPRRGPRKPYNEAVEALDVKALADLVHQCGARYLIFTTNHGNPTCPAPIASWEELHPGWTSRRDLIGELADALHEHAIRLMLYMNCPGLGGLMQQPGGALDVPSVSEQEYAEILVRVFSEFGHRYGTKIAGYWLDSWFQTSESYPHLPYPRLSQAIKTGNPDRLVAFNYWSFPIETEWQDYWSGELTDLPFKRFGGQFMRRGAGTGLQAHAAIRLDAPWFHITPDTDMEPPRYSATQLADSIRACMADKVPVTIGVGIFQDGTIGNASLAVLRQLKQMLRVA